jgi:hypothetical protein
MRQEIIEQSLDKIFNLFRPIGVSPTFGSSTTTGTINAGTSKISFRNSGGANATITSNGTSYTLEPDEIIVLEPGIHRFNKIITFDATGTTLKYIYY